MTEDDAKTKWCFHFIASHTDPRQREWRPEDHAAATLSSEPTGPFLHRCIASACMAWRTRREDHYRNAHGGLEEGPRTVGYCGLAGPQQ